MRPIYIPPIYIPPILLPSYLPSYLSQIEEELLALHWETKRTARHEYFMADGTECPCVMTCKVQDFSVTLPPCPDCGGTGRRPVDYSYGRKDDDISYTSKPWSPLVKGLLEVVWAMAGGLVRTEPGHAFNGCFLNKYDDQHQHLGWHADDFAGMDPQAPIAVMSFGAEREIWIKRKFAPCQRCGGDGSRSVTVPRMLTNSAGSSYRSRVTCSDCGGKGHTEEVVKGAVPPEDRYLLERGSLFIMPPGFQEVMLHRIPKHPQPCGWRISLTFRKFL